MYTIVLLSVGVASACTSTIDGSVNPGESKEQRNTKSQIAITEPKGAPKNESKFVQIEINTSDYV